MSQEAYEYVGRGLGLLKEGLTPFVETRLESNLAGHWKVEVLKRYPAINNFVKGEEIFWDVYALLRTMMIFWKDAFGDLKQPARSYVGEIYAVRNDWAHQYDFTREDADRALDTVRRLLDTIDKKGAGVKGIIDKLDELREAVKPATVEDIESTAPRYWKDYSPKIGFSYWVCPKEKSTIVSQVLKEEDLLNEIKENDQSTEALYKQIAIVLAAEGHDVLLNPSDPSIISDIDERRMSWTISVASYRLGRGVAWGIYDENLDFDTMDLKADLYRHAALSERKIQDSDIHGRVAPPYYVDGNAQPIGYSRVAATNPPFYSLETDSPWISNEPLSPEDKKTLQKLINRGKKRGKLGRPYSKSKPRIVKANRSEPDESDS